jgi:hypothetical protein
MMEAVEKVLIEIVVAAPIDAVWRALRDPDEIARWFGWKYPSLAEEIDYIFKRATESAADYRLTFGETGDVFTLVPAPAGTILRVTRAAPAGTDWEGIYDEIVEGWITFVEQLRFVLERHRGEDRRTLYLSGHTRPGGLRPPDALGLAALAGIKSGSPYALQLASGDAISGTVWFRSAHQLGLTVDQFGNGLLIVTNRPPTPTSEHGGGMAVLSLYGMADDEFEAFRTRWTAWWEGEFDRTEAQY